MGRAEGLVYADKLALAQSAFADCQVALALQYLDECQWDLRGWEHWHLWTRFNARQTLLGHTNEVTSVAFSPDGKHILTGGGDPYKPGKPGEAKVWDAATGQEVLTLKGHTDAATSVAFSPDGKRILTGSGDNTAKVWDADRGREILLSQGSHAACQQRGVQPRRPTHPHRQP